MKKVQNSKFKVQSSVDFLFEASTLKRLERTGWQVLGGNRESIAEHSFMVAVISLVLAQNLKANKEKVLTVALFHDFSEGRTGDIYKLADLYVNVDTMKAVKGAFSNLSASGKIVDLLQEYEEEESLEAKIVHDADTLALMIELKQLVENGNVNAEEWLEANLERLKLDESKKLGQMIKSGNSQNWWKKERDKIHKGFREK